MYSVYKQKEKKYYGLRDLNYAIFVIKYCYENNCSVLVERLPLVICFCF